MYNLAVKRKQEALDQALQREIEALARNARRRQEYKQQAHESYLQRVRSYGSEHSNGGREKSLESPWFSRQYIQGRNFSSSSLLSKLSDMSNSQPVRAIPCEYSDKPASFRPRDPALDLHPAMKHSLAPSPKRRGVRHPRQRQYLKGLAQYSERSTVLD
jgi:hypothetical protein